MSAARDEDLLALFREETADRLGRVVDTLLAVERGESDPDAVNATLREVHSIKGAAGMLALDTAASLAHALEDVLDRARTSGRLDPDQVSVLLRAVDALRSAVEREDVDADAVLAELGALASDDGDRAPATPEAEPERLDPITADGRSRSLRVDAAQLDAVVDTLGEAVLQQRRLEGLLDDPATASHERLDETLHQTQLRLRHLQDEVIGLRTLPLSTVTNRFPRMVRDAAAQSGKEVELTLRGVETQLDRVVLEGAAEAISHLLRNAVAHGIEPPDERERLGKPRRGAITLHARPTGERVAIKVADDGAGVASDLVAQVTDGTSLAQVLAAPGLTRAEGPTELSGRGVGLDAVLAHVQRLGGDLEVRTEPGRGTAFTLLLPISLARLHVLLAERAGCLFGMPMAAVGEVVPVGEPLALGGRSSIAVRGERFSLADPVELLGGMPQQFQSGACAVVATVGGARAAIAFDRVVGDDHALVKPLGRLLAQAAGYLGTALVGEGRIALILDPAYLVPRAQDQPARRQPAVEDPSPAAARPTRRVLVVDDQFTAREIQRSILEAAGYDVVTARDGREAWGVLTANGDQIDLVVTDVEMPEMDGLELLRAIRAHAERSSLPVVVVTSRGGEDEEREGLAAGADAYVVKQRFDQRALLDTVERLVSA